MSEAAGIAGALAAHWPVPVHGCECMPTDDETGITEALDEPWENHVAAAVLDHLRAVAANEAVRERIDMAVIAYEGGLDSLEDTSIDGYRDVAVTAFLAALGGDGGGMRPEEGEAS